LPSAEQRRCDRAQFIQRLVAAEPWPITAKAFIDTVDLRHLDLPAGSPVNDASLGIELRGSEEVMDPYLLAVHRGSPGKDRSISIQMTAQRFLSLRASNRRLAVRTLATVLFSGSAMSTASAQMLAGDGSVRCGSPYVVASGDTLSGLAERAYGDPMLYGFIADANWDTLGGNPENISVGMALTIPCMDASGEVLSPAQMEAATKSLEAVITVQGPLSPAELETLFGPVALFPDQVLTPVLVASTFPLDVVKAGRFIEASTDLPEEERAAEAASKPWDDSVRELAAGFPDLVTRMSDNIDWTEQAGEAIVAQTDESLTAIQRLRSRAQENGYLVDTEVQKVEEVDDKIVIAPAEPNVVYVPTYDSQVVYSTPIAGPPVYHYGYDYDDGYDWGGALVTGGIILGGAVVLDEIFDDDDWDGWDTDDDIDWDRGDITIDRGDVNVDIDRGDINVDGGDRISIGDSGRTQIDRGEIAGIGGRAGARERPGGGKYASISSDASREAARQKIEARKVSGVQPAELRSSRHNASSLQKVGTRPRAEAAANTRSHDISRPSAKRAPSAKKAGHSTAFERSSGGHRASAASSRGRSSMSRGGGGRGGGGRRR
jgi:uncharacterized membrane protein YgcG